MFRKIILSACFTVLFCHARTQIKLEIDIYTGDDNLERQEFQKNPEIRILLNGKPDVVKENINRGTTWANQSVHRITIDLPPHVQFREITAIHLRRDRVGSREYVWDYLKKDNWTVKGIVVTATVVNEGRAYKIEMLNKVNQQKIYRFTYDGNEVNPVEGIAYKAPLTPKLPVNTSGGLAKEDAVVTTSNAELTLVMGTGGDNLEGGNDNNVDIEIRFKNSGRIIRLNNVNQRQQWRNNTEITIKRELTDTKNIDINDIGWVTVKHTGGGGTFADNWDMRKCKITVTKSNNSRLLVNMIGLHRFTGSTREKEFTALGEAEQYRLANASITAVFGTGNDNLEGGVTNNVNLIIRFKSNGSSILIPNINKGDKWNNNTVTTITDKDLPNTFNIDIADIKEVEIRHTGGGGIGADNWNLNRFKLTIKHKGQTRELVDELRNDIHRFTGDSRKKIFVVKDVVTF